VRGNRTHALAVCKKLRGALRSVCFLFLIAATWGHQEPLFGAEDSGKGREVFRQQCAKCHGKQGEGVKGKYDDALHGDWSIDKLTRFIEKTMPEDDPDKINGPQVEAVARYINDAFYSREARARNHPARVELARLTNRQYVNTVADLLRQFTGDESPAQAERGLRGNYRSKVGKGDENRKSFDRVDRQVTFSLDAGSADAEQLGTGTNEINITWRGALVADESGDYEFIVKTPNGARLWINDEDTPLIDAWVASGKLDEHKATLRLLGGRAYPLRMEFFKAAKDKTASVALLWKPPHGAEELIPSRNLSTARATSTFVVTTPFPPDDSSVGYERGVAVSKAWDEAATQAAVEVANHVVKQLDRFSRSKPSDTNRAARVQTFCEEFVTAAFRRPLTTTQKREHVASQFKKAPKTDDAVKRVVLLTLKSPRFLYLGLDSSKPDDFEVASRLSFDLWDSLPNRELTKLAASGALHSSAQVSQQAQHMLDDPRAHAKMQYFLQHWLQMNRVEDFSKDTTLYPGFTPEIVADLRTSLKLFLDDVVWSPSSDYRRLLLEDDLFVNNRLASFYGVSTNADDDFVKVSFDPKQRSGVVTHPYLLAAFSYQKSSSPIHRGVFLTRNIVGRALKPPPMAQVFKDEDFAPNLTMREKVAQLTRPTACQSCHSVINPLGFSLEHYDAVGRFRTKEGGRSIDAASEYTTDDGEKVRLTGARDVAEFAVGSEHAQNAFIEHLFHQTVKQPIRAYGPDVQDRLRESFVKSGFNIQQLLVDIATLSALHGIEKAAKNKT
jgi:mono/diheme cytochrome c family protein